MRIIVFGLLLILVVGCTKEETLVPSAPTDLTGTALANEAYLSWKDNAINENGFIIERKIPTGIYAVVATVAPNTLSYIDENLTSDTTYIYRIVSFNEGGYSPTYSNECVLKTIIIETPKLVTTIPSYIANTRACSGGLISNDGGTNIMARGMVWSVTPNPTIALETKTVDGSGSGVFESSITGLASSTKYYIRAYAINSAGTAYGNEESFTTLNETSEVLPSIIIGTQTWMIKNLDVATYSDGTVIPQIGIGVSESPKWGKLTTGAWCYYRSDTESAYGKLYNWYAVAGIYDEASKKDVTKRKKMAPTGWHIPSDKEWEILINYLGGENMAGGKMKETGTSFWKNPNTSATNSSGFSALPGGVRYYYGEFNKDNIGEDGFWWSFSLYGSVAWYRSINYYDGHVSKDYTNKELGFSVRCIKD